MKTSTSMSEILEKPLIETNYGMAGLKTLWESFDQIKNATIALTYQNAVLCFMRVQTRWVSTLSDINVDALKMARLETSIESCGMINPYSAEFLKIY